MFQLFSLIRSRALIVLMALASISAVWGQATTSLRGIVSDLQGGSVASATAALLNDQTGFKRSVISDATGAYQFLQVPPGAYVLIVEKPGFAVSTQQGIQLLVNTPATLNVVLQLASITTTVNVEAEVITINTVDAAIGNAFNQTQVRQLPLQTRNVVELLSLQPGVTPTGEVLGSRRDQNNITLDGVDANDNQNSGLGVLGRDNKIALPGLNGATVGGGGLDRAAGFNSALPVPLDSVQEFRVTVGGQGADQGRSSGGQVALVTKGGTNKLHGSAYEFNRNTIFSANDWFNNRSGVKRQPLNRNQFGVSVGGPIKKDRVFFFFNYEKRLDRTATSQLGRVPSVAMRQGILTFKASDGSTTTLSPAQLKQIDPQHIGVSPAILSLLQQYPLGNDPSSGFDSGLNFIGYRFNAPNNLTNNSYVGKMDFHIDPAGRHLLSVRGSLAGNNQVQTPQSFPGQPTNNVLSNNSRGISALYTTVLSPTMVNVAAFGLTRIGLNQTGPSGASFALDSIDPPVNYNSRAYIRIAPTYNLNDDFTWTKNRHTITAGTNIRFTRNGYRSFANAWPLYLSNRAQFNGLGSDLLEATQAYLSANGRNSTVANPQALHRAFGDLIGAISRGVINYSYGKTGNPLDIGVPTTRNFATNEYAGYVSDSWRMKPGLTVTYGLRYENSSPPWETNGLQTSPTFSLQDFWAQRLGGAAAGIPAFQLANARNTYSLIGPANGQPSWFGRRNANFAPRLSFAYSPQTDQGLGAKILGKGGVFRAGASMAYDRFGSDMVVQFDNQNSFGLTENNVLGTFTAFNAPRYNGSLPALPAGSKHTFPFTPADVNFIGGTYVGMKSDLKTPYSYVLNASIARPLKGGMTLEVGYQGRLSHRLLLQQDVGGVAWNFKDPGSGITLGQANASMRSLYLQLSGNNPSRTGAVGNQIKANPSLAPANPFIEKYFGKIANLYFPGSATANYFYLLQSVQGLSDTDAVNQVDRLKTVNGKSFPNCISATGCYTFYTPQTSGLNTWGNNGAASYHGATVTLRRALNNGFSFDFNYTLSHSIDRGGGAESGGGTFGGIMLDPYNSKSYRGSSDFDARHNINTNFLYELPFGKGKMLLRNVNPVLDQIVGGWQISSIARYRSGLPSSIFYSGLFPTNFSFGAVAYPISSYSTGSGYDQKGNPAVFSSTDQASNWLPMYAGSVGTRAAIRLAGMLNFDIAVSKSFRLPFEGHRIQLRGEAFNAFNNVNFYSPLLDAASTSTFGEYQFAQPMRVMQFGLRYEF